MKIPAEVKTMLLVLVALAVWELFLRTQVTKILG